MISLILLFLCLPALASDHVPISEKGERHIVVITASYNNGRYFIKNLDSVFSQKYENYHVIYTNDCSQDGTCQLVPAFVKIRKKHDKVFYLENHKRSYALPNQYRAIHMCKPTDIIIILDGDDWLASNDVFSYLNKTYSDSNVWTTYGQFVQYPTNHRGWCKPIPKNVIARNGLRSYTHAPGHLRTFYASLFHKVEKEDLFYEGDFFHMTGDNAFTLPIYEMAGFHHKFIATVLMVYNIGNPLNDHKKIPGLQQKLDRIIRQREPYKPLDVLFEETDEKTN